jgi:hypothetical protein
MRLLATSSPELCQNQVFHGRLPTGLGGPCAKGNRSVLSSRRKLISHSANKVGLMCVAGTGNWLKIRSESEC